MNTVTGTTDRFAKQTNDLADRTAEATRTETRSAMRDVNGAFNNLSDKVDDARSDAAGMLSKAADKAQAYVDQGKDALRDTSQQVRDMANQTTDSVVSYVKDEPVKALLMAAAAGAVLMALVTISLKTRD